MVTAPHHLASQAGLAVLREGGNAIEAAIAAAATLSVVYPHMNGLGGDGFWLISEPNAIMPVSIDASGAAGANATPELYRQAGLSAVPVHGPLAANTVAGTVSGWQAALDISTRWGGRIPLARLLEEAIWYARNGFAITQQQVDAAARNLDSLRQQPNFAEHFLPDGEVPKAGSRMKLPALAETLESLAQFGLDDFYRGGVARAMAAEMQGLGCPVSGGDYARHRSIRRRPLSINISAGTVWNLQPPTQGLASLMILGLFDRLGVKEAEGFAHIHGIVEATKQAFVVRNTHVTDPAYMAIHSTTYLSDALLDRMAASIPPKQAQPWPHRAQDGDTVWLGVIDGQGRAVSFIQSLYYGFGSGVMLGQTGILLQNRGLSFRLEEDAQNFLRPGRKPFHTLNPAMARLRDGRVMVYGSMGGDAQPQTQAAIFTRYAMFGQDLQRAVTAPRWALGRSWGKPTSDLKLEDRFDPAVIEALRRAGHAVEVIPAFDSLMGHAGAIVRHESGLLEGASDPRSDGAVAAF